MFVSSFSVVCAMLRLIVYIALLVMFLLYAPFFLDIKPQSYRIPLPYSFDGVLKENSLLDGAERVAEGLVNGPESIASWKGELYTGTVDGRIVRINLQSNTTETVAQFSSGCKNNTVEESWDTSKCGRTLGVRFDMRGTLYAIDAYKGLYSVKFSQTSPEMAKVTPLLSLGNIRVGCRKSVYLDDLVIDQGSGTRGGHIVYMTDVSGKWDFNNKMHAALEPETNGRVLKYDLIGKNQSIVVERLWNPRGIEMTDNKEALLICESAKRKILKHYIRGPKAGETETFAEFLPGEPENIRRTRSKRETFWVTFSSGRTEISPLILDYLSEWPTTRLLIARLLSLGGLAMKSVGDLIGYKPLQRDGFRWMSGRNPVIELMKKQHSIVAEYDVQGMLVSSLHSPQGTIGDITEVHEMVINGQETTLFLGSNVNNYVARVRVKAIEK